MPQAKIGCRIRLLGATECGTRFYSMARYPAASERAGCIDCNASRQYTGLAFAGKSMTILELLEQVHDRESFLAFAYAFAEERRRVEGIELANPEVYQWGGAEGWNNNCISLFIEGGLARFEPAADGSVVENPTWKDLAEFLWFGSFME